MDRKQTVIDVGLLDALFKSLPDPHPSMKKISEIGATYIRERTMRHWAVPPQSIPDEVLLAFRMQQIVHDGLSMGLPIDKVEELLREACAQARTTENTEPEGAVRKEWEGDDLLATQLDATAMDEPHDVDLEAALVQGTYDIEPPATTPTRLLTPSFKPKDFPSG